VGDRHAGQRRGVPVRAPRVGSGGLREVTSGRTSRKAFRSRRASIRRGTAGQFDRRDLPGGERAREIRQRAWASQPSLLDHLGNQDQAVLLLWRVGEVGGAAVGLRDRVIPQTLVAAE